MIENENDKVFSSPFSGEQTEVGQGLIRHYGLQPAVSVAGSMEGHMTTVLVPRGLAYAR